MHPACYDLLTKLRQLRIIWHGHVIGRKARCQDFPIFRFPNHVLRVPSDVRAPLFACAADINRTQQPPVEGGDDASVILAACSWTQPIAGHDPLFAFPKNQSPKKELR